MVYHIIIGYYMRPRQFRVRNSRVCMRISKYIKIRIPRCTGFPDFEMYDFLKSESAKIS